MIREEYSNVQVNITPDGKKEVRKVYMKNGRGYKSIAKYRKNKRISFVRKPIHDAHVEHIKVGKFIPGLFADCVDCGDKKTRRCRLRIEKMI